MVELQSSLQAKSYNDVFEVWGWKILGGRIIIFCCHTRQSTGCRENVAVNELGNEAIANFSSRLKFPELRYL
jgi:hypothetical protein